MVGITDGDACSAPHGQTRHSASRVRWGKWVESVRKDVERAFGRLKGRFRCLKILSRFQDVTHVDMEFRACVVLHKTCHFSDGQWHLCLNHALMQFHGFTHVDLVPLAPFPGHMTLHVMP